MLRSNVWFLRFSLLVVGLIATTAVPQAEAGLCQGVAIPAYFYPGSLWTKAVSAAARTSIMIMNPNSGVGVSKDPQYASTVKAAQGAGVKVLGYVHTSYGDRALDTVKGEISLYKQWYRVDGIFLDETSSDSADLTYYKKLAKYIRARKGGYVMLNPGVVPHKGYVKLADTTIVFEGGFSSYLGWVAPSWFYNYPANKFTHLVHTTGTADQMEQALKLSATRNAGLIYVTDDQLANPWDTLPSYWPSLLDQITGNCRP